MSHAKYRIREFSVTVNDVRNTCQYSVGTGSRHVYAVHKAFETLIDLNIFLSTTWVVLALPTKASFHMYDNHVWFRVIKAVNVIRFCDRNRIARGGERGRRGACWGSSISQSALWSKLLNKTWLIHVSPTIGYKVN